MAWAFKPSMSIALTSKSQKGWKVHILQNKIENHVLVLFDFQIRKEKADFLVSSCLRLWVVMILHLLKVVISSQIPWAHLHSGAW